MALWIWLCSAALAGDSLQLDLYNPEVLQRSLLEDDGWTEVETDGDLKDSHLRKMKQIKTGLFVSSGVFITGGLYFKATAIQMSNEATTTANTTTNFTDYQDAESRLNESREKNRISHVLLGIGAGLAGGGAAVHFSGASLSGTW